MIYETRSCGYYIVHFNKGIERYGGALGAQLVTILSEECLDSSVSGGLDWYTTRRTADVQEPKS